jgi:hypothetical protein
MRLRRKAAVQPVRVVQQTVKWTLYPIRFGKKYKIIPVIRKTHITTLPVCTLQSRLPAIFNVITAIENMIAPTNHALV